MGNQGSCATGGGGIKVVGNDGRVRLYRRPIGVGELMRENRGHFVCDARDLLVGTRVPGLPAGEELERRGCYFILPMDMLYSVLTEEEMDELAGRASDGGRGGTTTKKRSGGGSVAATAMSSPVKKDEFVWREASPWKRRELDTILEDD